MDEQTTQNLSGDINTSLQLIFTELRAINVRLDKIEARLDNLETRVGNIETRLDSLEIRVGNLETRMDTLEEKVDRRLQETRPIWEAVLQRLTGVEREVKELRRGVKHRFKDIEYTQDELDERVERLENRDAA